jgi:hypothetical protein
VTAAALAGGLDPVRAGAYRRLAARWPADPAGYARHVLGLTLTPQQLSLTGPLFEPPFRLLVPSANKVGKTVAGAWLVNWFHDSFDPSVVLATSATFRSVRTQLFKEVRRQRPFGLDLKPRAPEIFHRDNHQVVGMSTKNPDSFQGQHEGRFLLLMDEATAIPAEIADRAETMFSGVPGHSWLCYYNPNDPTTWPYAAEQGGGWHVVRLSALDHPNVAAELRGEPPPYPGAVRLHRVKDRIGKECEDCGTTKADETCFEFPPGSNRWYKPVDPRFAPQVLGRWPSQSQTAVWSERDLEKALAAPPIDPTWPVQIGVDMARFGSNRIAFAVRWGTHVVHLESRPHTSWPTRRVSYHAAERLRELCHRYGPPAGMRPQQVPCLVDDSGGYGSGVCDYPEGYTFVGVNSAESARDPGKYPNKRSELWFVTRLAADMGAFYLAVGEGRHLVDELRADLLSARFTPDKRNRLVVEGKQQVKDRLGRSPDLADSLNLAFYDIG